MYNLKEKKTTTKFVDIENQLVAVRGRDWRVGKRNGPRGSKGEKEKKNNLNWQEKTTIDGAEMGIERTFTIL